MGHFHQLATDRSRLAAVGVLRSGPALRLVHGSDPTAGRHPSPTSPIPDPRPLVARLAQAIAEVLVRARQASQLDGLLTDESIRALLRATERTLPPGAEPMPRPTVSSLRLATPRAGAVEACAVIDLASRKRALAFRLELAAGRWQCTALRVG